MPITNRETLLSGTEAELVRKYLTPLSQKALAIRLGIKLHRIQKWGLKIAGVGFNAQVIDTIANEDPTLDMVIYSNRR